MLALAGKRLYQSEFCRETELRGWRYMEKMYHELTHIIPEAEEPHSLSFASWRMRKVGPIIQFKYRGPRTRSTICEDKRRWILQLNWREQICPSQPFLFCCDTQWIRQYLFTLVREVFFTQSTDTNAILFSKYPHRYIQK